MASLIDQRRPLGGRAILPSVAANAPVTAFATEASHSLEAFWLQEKAGAKATSSGMLHATQNATQHATQTATRNATRTTTQTATQNATQNATPLSAAPVGQCLALNRTKRSKRSVVMAYPSEDDEEPIVITQTCLLYTSPSPRDS